MNNFIFSFHPTGLSMERFLASQGFDVWSANLRGQGRARRHSGPAKYGFRELALVDLPTAKDTVLAETRAEAPGLDIIGCSLGAAITYAWMAHHPTDHGVGAMVSIGGPLRWERVHPLIKVAFTSPRLAGVVPIRGTRQLARLALPLARKVPAALSIYMNAHLSDLSQAEALVKTVEDPHPWLNRQLARWMQDRDLVVDGVNVTEALKAAAPPLLVVAANSDGIVPPEVALSVRAALGPDRVQVLEVGDDLHRFAHADLFISRLSHDRVFLPMSQWLIQHNP
jgi:alpha-beta hydrolase superfamily lysophospholipase